jgi:hypothetical protein
MIIKGKSRSGPAALAAHLGNAEKNERVSLLETRGTIARDLRGALIEMDACAIGTRCTKPLYHAAISPEPPHRLTPEQREEAINTLEAKLGLDGHARVVVMHEKLGREHIHVVWSRIDTDRMRSVSDSHNYRKHEEVARDLERRFGHDRVQGAHAERDGVDRPDRTPSRAELRQEERTGIKGKEVKREVSNAFRTSDNAGAFKAALEDKGYILAQGDQRDFVIVDRAGGIHSLARRIDGVNAAELREFMRGVSRDEIPSLGDIKSEIDERRQRSDAIKKEKSYSRGDDYVSQTQAALKDHQRRQKRVGDEPRPQRPAKELSAYERMKANSESKEAKASKEGPSAYERMKEKLAGKEITDGVGKMLDRLTGEGRDNIERRDREDPDRQREAPGGGRTRSR